MAYNFELSISARVSPKTVEEIVKAVVEEQTGRKVDTIEAKSARVSRGMGPGATTEDEFNGYYITFVAEKPVKEKSKQEPLFKEDKYE
jgi:hypothetical protein